MFAGGLLRGAGDILEIPLAPGAASCLITTSGVYTNAALVVEYLAQGVSAWTAAPLIVPTLGGSTSNGTIAAQSNARVNGGMTILVDVGAYSRLRVRLASISSGQVTIAADTVPFRFPGAPLTPVVVTGPVEVAGPVPVSVQAPADSAPPQPTADNRVEALLAELLAEFRALREDVQQLR